MRSWGWPRAPSATDPRSPRRSCWRGSAALAAAWFLCRSVDPAQCSDPLESAIHVVCRRVVHLWVTPGGQRLTPRRRAAARPAPGRSPLHVPALVRRRRPA